MHVSAELCLAAIERRCQIPDCSITAMKYAHLLLSTGACLASLPLLSRFGVGADLICSLCCLPPWGEEPDMQLLWLPRSTSHSGNTLFLAVGILEIPITSAVVFPLLPHHGYSEFGCRLRQSSPSVIQGVPILSLADLPVSCALEPAKGSC